MKSKYNWAHIGTSYTKEKENLNVSDELMERLIRESFIEGRIFYLVIYGLKTKETGSLSDIENGFDLFKKESNNYRHGSYCILSRHEEIDLLFAPVEKILLPDVETEKVKSSYIH